MTDTNQKQLGNTLWSIANPRRGLSSSTQIGGTTRHANRRQIPYLQATPSVPENDPMPGPSTLLSTLP